MIVNKEAEEKQTQPTRESQTIFDILEKSKKVRNKERAPYERYGS